MFNLKLITSKSVQVALLTALVAQTSVQAFSVTEFAIAGKNLVQKTVSDVASSEFVGTATEYVKSTGNKALEFADKNRLLTAYVAALGIWVTAMVAEEYAQAKRIKEQLQRYEAMCAAEEAERRIKEEAFNAGKEAQQEAFLTDKQAHIDALELEDFVKLVNANVMEAQQLFNEVDGAHILQLNNARYNYDLSEEEMDALVQELMFACVAQESNSYKLTESERLIQKALEFVDLRSYYKGTLDIEVKVKIDLFLREVQEVRALINDFAAMYQEQEVAALNEKVALYQEQQALERTQKVAEYRAQNPTEQVTLIAHTCGNNCLKALMCDCSGCACTAETALQS